ncbi:hypothetical protein BCR36DRAFT_416903 [Piromyces finnis]|uniref:Uncharacterized protein n=1 Tax=Piromyces finnis TaxID=1754191 RepID=A0A1Y1UQT8_9FUNG|nr:hypothetical protein BCR36DRAFT_416903 [Piromyces finnis]|eukprot:ORX40411.1 hypothetical protein BCR36DRAFT_416903 [Piromyces finnis]
MNNLNIFDAYSLALQEDKNSIYSKIGINVILHDKKFSKNSIQWCNYSIPSHLYIAIDKLNNENIVKNIDIKKEPSIQVNRDVEHIDYKLYNIGEKIYAISMNSDIIRSYFPGQLFLQLSENGKEIIYNYINIVPNSYRNGDIININQSFEMELDQKMNNELSKKYGFSVDPSILLKQYEHHPNPEIAFIGKELYHYIKDSIQYRIRFSLDSLVKLQLFEVNTQDIYKFKNENLLDNFNSTSSYCQSNNNNNNLDNIYGSSNMPNRKNKRCYDDMNEDINSIHNDILKLMNQFQDQENEEIDENETKNMYDINYLSKKTRSRNTTYVLVFEWKYPPETFQKIPLWNNRLKRKAYLCHDWTKNESATHSSRHFIFGTKACLTSMYYSILKKVQRLAKVIKTNNLIFEPNIIKHRIFPKPFLKERHFSSSPTPIFDKNELKTKTIQNLRQIVFKYDLYDEIDMDLGSDSIIRDLLLFDVKNHDQKDFDLDVYHEIATSIYSEQSHIPDKNSYYCYFNNMNDQAIQSMFIIPDPTFKVLQNYGFNFEQQMPYGLFKIKLEKYPPCFQNFLWNHIKQPEILINYFNEMVPVEVQWNYQIPDFLISIVKEGDKIYSTLNVSTFTQHNTNPDIYWCFCQRRMLTTDYYHHCQKCGICYDINYWHCDGCQKCSIGQNVGICNFCGKARGFNH